MKSKRVWRYYCDYCKKSNCSKHSIKKHERGCTKNPERVCGYCKLIGQQQPEMDDLLSVVPDIEYTYTATDEVGGRYISSVWINEFNQLLPKLREVAGNCPACIMAAIRQKGIPVPIADGFDFKKECQRIWDEINAENWRKEQESCIPY